MITLGRRRGQGILIGTGFVYVRKMYKLDGKGQPRAHLTMRAREGSETFDVTAAGEKRIYQVGAGATVELTQLKPEADHVHINVRANRDIEIVRFELLRDAQLTAYVPKVLRPRS